MQASAGAIVGDRSPTPPALSRAEQIVAWIPLAMRRTCWPRYRAPRWLLQGNGRDRKEGAPS